MALTEEFPLRIEAVTAAWASERRPQDDFSGEQAPGWQLVYVRSGAIEELCGERRVLLRAGGILLHQPEETFGMQTRGEIPPEVLRMDFFCAGSAMDRFRGLVFHAEPAEQHDLNWLMKACGELYEAPPAPGGKPVPREDVPFGARQQLVIHLENLLILLARRCKRPRKPTQRIRRERRQTALVEAARAYLAQNLEREVRVEEVCAAVGCTRTQLQQELLNTWEKEQKTCFFITHDVEEAIILAQRVVIMCARPGRVKDIVDIDIPYPRDQETKMSPRFLELKNHIWSQVYQEYLSVRK